jgi:hypothetical protein
MIFMPEERSFDFLKTPIIVKLLAVAMNKPHGRRRRVPLGRHAAKARLAMTGVGVGGALVIVEGDIRAH